MLQLCAADSNCRCKRVLLSVWDHRLEFSLPSPSVPHLQAAAAAGRQLNLPHSAPTIFLTVPNARWPLTHETIWVCTHKTNYLPGTIILLFV